MTGTDAVEAAPLVITPTSEPPVAEETDPDDLAEFWRRYHDIVERRRAEQERT